MAPTDEIEMAVRPTETDGSEIEAIRKEIRRMPNAELLRFGVNAKFRASRGLSPKDPWLAAQLKEARAEWNRRHPCLPLCNSF
jgi:hypothetical protein